MTQLSIGITAHAEGITLHKTLLSVKAASQKLIDNDVSFEILLQLDNPDRETFEYSTRIINHFPSLPITISSSSFGNPSESRNDIVSRAKGHYITFVDGDDLISRNWLIDSIAFLQQAELDAPEATHVAHPEVVMEFDSTSTIIKRHGEIDRESDTLLSAFANRWNVVLMIRRSFFVENPYPTEKGYGFEDWYINCLTIHGGLHNTLIPQTSLFVRRKRENSVWLTHQSDFAVLPKNPLLSFSNIRNTDGSAIKEPVANPSITAIKRLLRRARVAGVISRLRHTVFTSKTLTPLPAWLQEERDFLYKIDKTLNPFSIPTPYDSLTDDHYRAAVTYKRLIDTLPYDSYGYIIFAPWLTKGGADLFTLNYANTIADITPGRKILLITTTATDSAWASRLNENVSLLEFGKITNNQPEAVTSRLLEHVVENSGASHIHVINSERGYKFIGQHKKYLKATNKTVLATSFSQSTDGTGRIFGYSHTHVPPIYDIASIITTDNTPVQAMWVTEYGFKPSTILVHSQPVSLPKHIATPNKEPSKAKPINILWAARLSPEKQPHILKDIAEQLSDKPVHIHIYGQPDEGFDTTFLSRLPGNTTYHGPFNGFDSLDPHSFDIYLYTSLFDGMPNSILEAASYGLPIVASSVGGIPDLIEDAVDGLLVSDLENAAMYVDKINSLLDNPGKLISFGKLVRAKIESDFSETSYRKQITAMLKKVKYL